MQVKIITIFLYLVGVCIAQDDENDPQIVKWTRTAEVRDGVNFLIVPIPYVVIHYTNTSECNDRAQCVAALEHIHSIHVEEHGWNDIGYSFLIGGDGSVFEGRGWTLEGRHTSGYNKKSIGIAFIGNYQGKPASDKMLEAAHKLILCGKSQGILRDNVRVMRGITVSPDSRLSEQIQNWPELISSPWFA